MGSQVSVLVAAYDHYQSVSLTPSGTPHPADDGQRSVFSAATAGLTPAAAADRSAFAEIPNDVSRCILECMDLSARVKLSTCSKALGGYIFSKSYLWESIDFGAELSYRQRQLLTDRSVYRLLENVDAKRVTKVLSVRFCGKIQGYSLEPLRGSVVLEDLDLSVHAGTYPQRTGLDDSFVIDLLQSMMPFARPTETNQRKANTSRLFTVRFTNQRNPTRVGDRPMRMHECFNPYSRVRNFMESFDGSLKDRLWADRVPCGHCNCVLVEKIPTDVFESTDASAIRCAQCNTLSCGQKGCKSTCRCQWCYNAFCCVEFKRCGSCNRDACLRCDVLRKCDGPCNRVLCDGCLHVVTCDECGKTFCEECGDSFYCYECDEQFCLSCRDLEWCECCRECFCSTCVSEPLDCSKCQSTFCGWCEKDALRACDACDRLVCGGCDVSPTPCGGCNGLFCCRDMSEKCTTCLEQYCSTCQPLFDPCSLCEKCPTCCTDVSWCSQCEQSFGKQCREVYECRGTFT